MQLEPVRKEKYKGCDISIYPDEMAISPREYDTIGTIVDTLKDYNFADEKFAKNNGYRSFYHLFAHHICYKYEVLEPKESNGILSEREAEIVWDWINENIVYLPLTMLEHGITRLKTGSGSWACDAGGWDSGTIGYVYSYKEDYKKIYGRQRDSHLLRKTIRDTLYHEIDTFDKWLNNEVYLAQVENKLGFRSYIDNWYDAKDLIQAAKEEIDRHRKNVIEKHIAKVKAYIKNNVPLIYRKPLKLAF